MKQQLKPAEFIFTESEKTLTLGGEPVLIYRLASPTFNWEGRDARLLQRYYTHFFTHVEARWQKSCYIDACLHLIHQRDISRDPILFQCAVAGQGTFIGENLLSLCFDLTELRGTDTPIHIRHCDLWDLTHVVPISLKELIEGRFWHKKLMERTIDALERGQEAYQFQLYDDWNIRLRRHNFSKYFQLTGSGLTLYFPQYSISHSEEIISIPLGWDTPIKPALCPVPREESYDASITTRI